MAIKNLYIIGNGFDLHHCINSRYEDFRDWLLDNRFCYGIHDDEIFGCFKCENLWSSFEENLALFDYEGFAKQVAEENRPNMMSDHPEASLEDARVEVENQLEDWWRDVKCGLSQWVLQLNDPCECARLSIPLEDAFFLTFNYTLTLENFYKVPSEKVLHIHGMSGQTAEELFLGHGGNLIKRKVEDVNIYGEDGDLDYSMLPDPNDHISEEQAIASCEHEVMLWKKPVGELIERHSQTWESFGDVRKVFAYGLSFSNIDIPYLQKIISSSPHCEEWIVSYYTDVEKEKFGQILKGLGVENFRLVRLVELKRGINRQKASSILLD